MKTYSGSTSEGFLPATLPGAAGAAAVAPAPQDPSATFSDALDQLTPKTPTGAPAAADFSGEFTTTIRPPLVSAPPTPLTDEATPVDGNDVAPAFSGSPLSSYLGLGQPAGAASFSTTAGTGEDDAVSADESSSLPLPAAALFFTATPTAAAKTPAATPTTLPATSDDEGAPEFDLGENTSASASSGKPATASASFSWFGQRTAPGNGGTSRTSTTASTGALSSSPAGAATSFPAGEETDFTGAAIVASVFGRASAPAPAAALSLSAPEVPDAATASTTWATPLPAGSPLATLIAHATILAAATKGGATSAAPTDTSTSADLTPLHFAAGGSVTMLLSNSAASPAAKAANPTSISEKKSAASSLERSFLQEGSGAVPATDTSANLMQAVLAASSNLAGNQAVTTSSSAVSSTSERALTGSISTAGMANGKNVDDMTTMPEMTSLVVSSGTHPLVTSTSADLHIALASNHDFTDALTQVMHVAELSNMSRSTPPLRVAIEIQTPPGAIVNVYISRQSDSSYRAQLSTNDAQALSWVQGQISSLKDSTGTGAAIRWSPAQLEPGTTSLSTSSSSTGDDHGYDWDRGGQQGQSGYEQEERAPRLPVLDDSDEPEAAFAAFGALGGVA